MSQTKIEWCDTVWNPVTGCTPVSEGCHNCYARRMANRLRGRFGYPEDDPFRVTLHPERLEEPLRWRKPRRVFVCSMGDLFHPDVPFEFIAAVFRVMTKCTQHTFVILTKRPNQVKAFYLLSSGSAPWAQKVCENIWVGVTAENQQAADERIPILLQIPVAVHFISVEPMLGPINVFPYLEPKNIRTVKWVIAGGETGPNARPMHPDWVRSLRDQCQASGTPFFFKQWGQWNDLAHGNWIVPAKKDKWEPWADSYVLSHKNKIYDSPDGCRMISMGKKAAGRILDGRTWDEMPSQVRKETKEKSNITEERICEKCGGLGEVREYIHSVVFNTPLYRWVKCDACDGTGEITQEAGEEPCLEREE